MRVTMPNLLRCAESVLKLLAKFSDPHCASLCHYNKSHWCSLESPKRKVLREQAKTVSQELQAILDEFEEQTKMARCDKL